MILYLDTSALMKLVLAEQDSDEAWMLWGAATRQVSSRLAYVECRAGLAAAHRIARITSDEHRLAAMRLDRRMNEMDEIDLDEGLSRDAGDVATRGRLRGADAVHLATALRLRDAEVLFATWDRDLARAAAEVALQVVPASR